MHGRIAQSSSCNRLFIAPGNAGTSELGKNVNINVNDFDKIKDFVLCEEVDLVLVGLEDPLVNGIYDFFQQEEDLKHYFNNWTIKRRSPVRGE